MGFPLYIFFNSSLAEGPSCLSCVLNIDCCLFYLSTSLPYQYLHDSIGTLLFYHNLPLLTILQIQFIIGIWAIHNILFSRFIIQLFRFVNQIYFNDTYEKEEFLSKLKLIRQNKSMTESLNASSACPTLPLSI